MLKYLFIFKSKVIKVSNINETIESSFVTSNCCLILYERADVEAREDEVVEVVEVDEVRCTPTKSGSVPWMCSPLETSTPIKTPKIASPVYTSPRKSVRRKLLMDVS